MQTRPKSCSHPANATDSVTAPDPVVVVEAAEAADTSPTPLCLTSSAAPFRMGPASGRQSFSRAVRCSVSGATTRNPSGFSRN
jgi:hypothetical protein